MTKGSALTTSRAGTTRRTIRASPRLTTHGRIRAASSTFCASTSTATRRKWCRVSAARRRGRRSLFALGWTQHSVGAQNIRTMAMVQLLLGNIGVAGGGMNALRGHSNIQGLTDVGLLSNQIPGYLTLPSEHEVTFDDYMKTRQYKPVRPGQTSYWQNYRSFMISFQKALYGDAAQAES